ncbi:alpha/beta hydrolase [Sphaerisporangium sp. NPDC051017]|uniref:alpha/beta fold hydrolase n=1 Tax=Sphaerisporangium sp. NPDC051017 TaxID=3154636 RepID=UPI00342BEE19
MSSNLPVSDHEFAALPGLAEDLGLPAPAPRLVQRRWVTTVSGGHVSGVTWGADPPEAVLLHDARRGARSFDRLLLRLGRPALALDLPGHGRSGRRASGVYAPRRIAPAVAEAIRSFAPAARVVLGEGLGALTAIALAVRSPGLVGALVLVDTLPGSLGAPAVDVPDRLASREEALEWLRKARPDASERDLDLDLRHEAVEEPGGAWTWRHDPRAGAAPDDETLWEPLAGLAAREVPIVLLRPPSGARAGETAVEELLRHAPAARIVTVTEPELAGHLRDVIDTTRRSAS